MQFSCESCKAQLQIADEKVRGKRLIVRCKRCGAKIGISDPALGVSRPAAPKPAAPGVAAPRSAVPSAAARPDPRDSDTESTRAMDSDLLEQALQASKADDPSLAPRSAAKPAGTSPVADGAEWFAMLHGKQTGPLTRAELSARTDQGEVGPRTYLWKEGMDAWQRAKDLPDLASLFPQLPPPAPPAPPPPAAPPVQKGVGLREFSAEDFAAADSSPAASVPPRAAPASLSESGNPESVAKDLFSDGASSGGGDLAGWAGAELQTKKPSPRRKSAEPFMFEGAAPPRSRVPFMVVVIGIAAVAAVVFWLEFRTGASSSQKAGQAADAGVIAVPPKAGATPAEKPPAPVEKAEEKPPATADENPPAKAEAKPAAKPEAKPPAKPAEPAAMGLTADQVRKKLDENKASLQACIDEALKRDSNLRVGKIHISTTIAPSGRVIQARIDKSTVDESPLGACLRKATKKIVFPSFSGGAFDVDIPIVVTAGE